jgi:hypothetical protein
MSEPIEMRAPQHFVALSQVRTIVRDEVQKFSNDVLVPAIGQAIGEMAREAEAQFAAKLEGATKEFAYKGQWVDGTQYKRGNFVSMGGQVYHANVDTRSRPSTDGTWTLACKSGRDGRDGRDIARQTRLRNEQRGAIDDDAT